jgi:hypothetical protein
MIENLIAETANRTGLPIDQARELQARLMGFATASLGADRLAPLFDRLPDVQALMESSGSARYDLSASAGSPAAGAVGRFGAKAGPPYIAEQLGVDEGRLMEAARALVSFTEREAGAGIAAELRAVLLPSGTAGSAD